MEEIKSQQSREQFIESNVYYKVVALVHRAPHSSTVLSSSFQRMDILDARNDGLGKKGCFVTITNKESHSPKLVTWKETR